jgi:hypothetical protein
VSRAGGVPALPTSGHLVRISLDLGAEAARRLRGASIYVALVTLGLLGPVGVALIVLWARHPELFSFDTVLDPTYDPFGAPSAPEGWEATAWIALGMVVAIPGLVAMAVESQAMSAAILAGVALGRPVSTLEALRRSRQVFWRLVGYAAITAIPISIATQLLSTALLEHVGQAYETVAFVTTLFAALLGLPFVYGVTAIVLGDVAAVEAARRSIMLARARWRLAVVISLVSTVAVYLAIFAFSGALDVIVTIGGPLGISIDDGPLAMAVLIALALALSAAIGSLLLTVTAIVVGPQVVAFLGLTHYSGGLDRARDATVLRPPVRYLTPLMGLAVGVAILCGVAAVATG